MVNFVKEVRRFWFNKKSLNKEVEQMLAMNMVMAGPYNFHLVLLLSRL